MTSQAVIEGIDMTLMAYQQWRARISRPAFFVLAACELALCLAVWAAVGFLLVSLVFAPLLFGEAGLVIWGAVFILVMAVGMVMDRKKTP